MGANFRYRKTGPELGHQHRCGQDSVVGATIAPAEHVDLVRYQFANGNGRDLLFVGVLPPAFEGSHGTSEISGTIKNITRTFDAVNDDPEQIAQAAPRELPCRGRYGFELSVAVVYLANRYQAGTPFDCTENIGQIGVLAQPDRPPQ